LRVRLNLPSFGIGRHARGEMIAVIA
jgi:hypothetical protein